ncbi:hypothetical protein [Seonamhaeicola marinus]|uniref:Uncharacterized protein n=1 Tax=Seonamhaeicola marinus TaxID=1912246 RepID=A0A5D0I876_9FLAO|nr:hypothetical protein [Seonamhaeicola marinus]TYA78627.1 hypothetical protein FUA24_09755 [Seonamhaeicola marinus]
MRLTKLLLCLLLVFTFSCSSSSGGEINPDDYQIVDPEEENDDEETEEEEEEEQQEVTTVDGIKIGPDYVVFEPEVTKSDLGLWVLRKKGEAGYYPDTDKFKTTAGEIPALNDNYLEFTGNNLNGGAAKSPLTYTFVCPKTAKFRLTMRMLQTLEACTPGTEHCANDGYEKGDKRNDLWFKLEGDFTTASAFATEELKKNHKFWGRGVRKWGSIHKMEGHINGSKRHSDVVVNFKKGEEYTLTISGRAQGCGIDYILFYDKDLEAKEGSEFTVETHTDLMAALPEHLRPDIID